MSVNNFWKDALGAKPRFSTPVMEIISNFAGLYSTRWRTLEWFTDFTGRLTEGRFRGAPVRLVPIAANGPGGPENPVFGLEV